MMADVEPGRRRC